MVVLADSGTVMQLLKVRRSLYKTVSSERQCVSNAGRCNEAMLGLCGTSAPILQGFLSLMDLGIDVYLGTYLQKPALQSMFLRSGSALDSSQDSVLLTKSSGSQSEHQQIVKSPAYLSRSATHC